MDGINSIVNEHGQMRLGCSSAFIMKRYDGSRLANFFRCVQSHFDRTAFTDVLIPTVSALVRKCSTVPYIVLPSPDGILLTQNSLVEFI